MENALLTQKLIYKCFAQKWFKLAKKIDLIFKFCEVRSQSLSYIYF